MDAFELLRRVTIVAALQLAARAYAGRRDKERVPAILHTFRVMHRVQGEAAQIVATLDDLRAAGFRPASRAASRVARPGGRVM